jgi:hypothetical protein
MFRTITYWISYPFYLIYESLVCRNNIELSKDGDTEGEK